jgi:hypothetical protein
VTLKREWTCGQDIPFPATAATRRLEPLRKLRICLLSVHQLLAYDVTCTESGLAVRPPDHIVDGPLARGGPRQGCAESHVGRARRRDVVRP